MYQLSFTVSRSNITDYRCKNIRHNAIFNAKTDKFINNPQVKIAKISVSENIPTLI